MFSAEKRGAGRVQWAHPDQPSVADPTLCEWQASQLFSLAQMRFLYVSLDEQGNR